MSEHFNNLTPQEAELLALLSEECGECIQAIGKILRHGLTSYHPDHGDRSNRANLTREIGDIRAVVRLLCHAGVISASRVDECTEDKLKRVYQYLHHVTPHQKEGARS